MTIPDIENLLILLSLFLLFLSGFKRKNVGGYEERKSIWQYFVIDKDTSIAIKGIACVFVLMGHYGSWLIREDASRGIITSLVTHTTANIALAWFMFFSGYGLSLKTYESNKVLSVWFSRFKKLYIPLLYVCIIAVVVYLILPYNDQNLAVISWYYDIHRITKDNLFNIAFHVLGLNDWYVICIIYFITLFYLSVFISKKKDWNTSVVLTVLMICYIAVAYFVYGPPEAHFYRYPWAFIFGHFVATHDRNSRITNVLLVLMFLVNWVMLDKICLSSCIIAVFLLAIIGALNHRFDFNGKILLFLGGISYFFYLSHQRIGWLITISSGIEYFSLIFWVIITVICSYILDRSYKYLSKVILV